jgi:orotidine-5'-phosphate decarboxylase
MYAKAFFLNNDFDAVTVSPYMGEDSIKPFLKFENKWAIVLALTSNKGAGDFQLMEENGEKLFERVLHVSQNWGNEDNLMYVVGATKAEMLDNVRKIVPNHFLLVPGVGAQGGSLQEVAKHGLNSECGLLVNSSRQIIYASSETDFAEKARYEAQLLQKEMEEILKMNRLV